MLNNYIKVIISTSLIQHTLKFDFSKSTGLKFYDSLFYKHKKQFTLGINFGKRRLVFNCYPSGQKALRFYFNHRYTIKDYTQFYN